MHPYSKVWLYIFFYQYVLLHAVDLLQGLFDPVSFNTRNETEEKRAYMMFTRFLTEAEGRVQ